jgi:alpha-beta hydrolase superfamily lysophospholipase
MATPRKGTPPAWNSNFAKDPLYQSGYICPHNVILLESLVNNLQNKTLKNIKLPFTMILAGREELTCNDAARQFYESSKQRKELIVYDDCCHIGVTSDKEYWP